MEGTRGCGSEEVEEDEETLVKRYIIMFRQDE